eukprot:jgi/Tetstr1/462181/TSEL_007246.t1
MELPVGKNVLEKVKAMVVVWRAGSERKAAMNDNQWSAAVNQQRDPMVVLKKGEAGFKEWNAAEVKQLLTELSDALAAGEDTAAKNKAAKEKEEVAVAQRDVQGLAAERLAIATDKPVRQINLEAMRTCVGHAEGEGHGDINMGTDSEEDEWCPLYVEEVFDLTAEEVELLWSCTGHVIRDLPLPDVDAAELPSPWSVLDFNAL